MKQLRSLDQVFSFETAFRVRGFQLEVDRPLGAQSASTIAIVLGVRIDRPRAPRSGHVGPGPGGPGPVHARHVQSTRAQPTLLRVLMRLSWCFRAILLYPGRPANIMRETGNMKVGFCQVVFKQCANLVRYFKNYRPAAGASMQSRLDPAAGRPARHPGAPRGSMRAVQGSVQHDPDCAMGPHALPSPHIPSTRASRHFVVATGQIFGVLSGSCTVSRIAARRRVDVATTGARGRGASGGVGGCDRCCCCRCSGSRAAGHRSRMCLLLPRPAAHAGQPPIARAHGPLAEAGAAVGLP